MKLCAKKIPIMTVKGSFFKIKSKNFKLNVLIRQYIVATVVVSLENVFMNSLTIHKVLETLMILTLWSQNLNVFFCDTAFTRESEVMKHTKDTHTDKVDHCTKFFGRYMHVWRQLLVSTQ